MKKSKLMKLIFDGKRLELISVFIAFSMMFFDFFIPNSSSSWLKKSSGSELFISNHAGIIFPKI